MPRPRSDIDRRIVRAARARFLAEGVDGASLRAIAEAAKTNLGMISYYFPTKDDLFLAVVEEVYAAFLRDLEAILGDGAPFADRLRRISRRIGALSERELDVLRIVLREALSSSSRFRRVLARFQRGHIPMLLSALTTAIEQGEIERSIPMPVLLGCVLGTMGAPQVLRRVLGGELGVAVPSVEETAEVASSVLFGGIRPRAGTHASSGRARRSRR